MVDRKTEILGVAEELLLVKGFNAFSYQDLSAQLGITKASIHHHFPTKEDLGIALCDRFAELYGQLEEAAKEAGGTPTAMLETLLHFGAEMAEKGDRCCPGGMLQAEYESLPEGMQRRVDELFAMVHERTAAMLAAGREAGEFAFEGSPSDAAWLLLSTKQGAILTARVHGVEVYHAIVRQLKSSLLA